MKRAVIFLVLAALLAGCASSSRSVRAIRQYEREPADINAVLDRIEDLELCLTLVNRLLLETPYSPGDPWVQQVSLNEASANTIEQELRASSSVYSNPDLRVPVAKVYAVHVDRALDAHAAVARTSPPQIPQRPRRDRRRRRGGPGGAHQLGRHGRQGQAAGRARDSSREVGESPK